MERPEPEMGTQGETTGARIVAIVVDSILVGIVTGIVVYAITSASPRLGAAIGWVVALVLYYAYFIYMEGTYGQTIGKRAMNIVVVKEDGTPCDMTASAIRNVLRIVDGIFVYLVGLVVILVTDDNQRVGDLVADTVVVRTRE